MKPVKATQGKEQVLSLEQKTALLQIARQEIESRLGIAHKKRINVPKGLDFKAGAFVTLTIDGDLRGCIGCIEPRMTLLECVKENAANAAFEDPRFQPLQKQELKVLRVEISVLSVPKKLDFSSPEDLLEKIRVGIDGVILDFGHGLHSTFLPQVWEQIPDKQDFLAHLSRKVGMPSDAWKKAEVYIYTVEAFGEAK